MDAMLALTNIAVILLLGLLCSLLARKIAISDVLVLLVLGILLGRLAHDGMLLFAFDSSFLAAIGVLALVMVAFDSASRFRLEEKARFAPAAGKLLGFFVLFAIIVLPIFVSLLFFKGLTLTNILLALIFTLIVVGTDLDAITALLRKFRSERAASVLALLEAETILNTLLVVIIPFIIIDIIRNLGLWGLGAVSSFGAQLPLLLFQLIIGVGAGIVIGLIVLRTMQRFYHRHFSPIALIAAALISYILAENLGGNGVLAVAALGFLFGRIYVKEKPKLQEFSAMLSNALEILVFVLIGIVVKLPLSASFILKSVILFIILVACRLAATHLSLKKSSYSAKEKLFIGLNMPKGIAVAAVVFSLALYNAVQLAPVLNLIVAFMIYSLILSNIAEAFSGKFFKYEKQNENISGGRKRNIKTAKKLWA